MKKFADLHLKPNLENKKQVEEIVCKASELGYSLLGFSLPPRVKQDTILLLQQTCETHGVDMVTRIDLTPRSSNDLLRDLRKYRRKFELVSVNCLSKSVARQAAKDHRVDLLNFSSTNPQERFFDHAEATLASRSSAAPEVNMALILQSTGFRRTRLLSSLRREVETARKHSVPIIISSGATESYKLRGPHDFASLTMLFGMANECALRALSETPYAIVERNRRKLDASYIAEGIRVVRRGKDCEV